MRLDPKGAVPHAEFFSYDQKIGKILELKKKSSVNWTSFASIKKKNWTNSLYLKI
jgi:hypothetical protein